MRSLGIVLVFSFFMFGCMLVYYGVFEQIGIEKCDIFVDCVKDGWKV